MKQELISVCKVLDELSVGNIVCLSFGVNKEKKIEGTEFLSSLKQMGYLPVPRSRIKKVLEKTREWLETEKKKSVFVFQEDAKRSPREATYYLVDNTGELMVQAKCSWNIKFPLYLNKNTVIVMCSKK